MSAGTTIAGVIHKIMPVHEINDSFTKRDVVVNTGGDYPQLISIQFVQDQVFLFNDILEGANVVIDVNIRGREWTSPQGEVKYFNTLQGWKVEQVNNGSPKPQQPASQNGIPKQAIEENANDADDDLPF